MIEGPRDATKSRETHRLAMCDTAFVAAGLRIILVKLHYTKVRRRSFLARDVPRLRCFGVHQRQLGLRGVFQSLSEVPSFCYSLGYIDSIPQSVSSFDERRGEGPVNFVA